MKKLFGFLVIMLISNCCFCQQVPLERGSKAYYLQKSKNQKSAARTLIIAGPILIGAGFLIGDRKESTFDDAATGAIVGGLGVLSCLGSIPLFLASSRNAERARSVSVHFKMESRRMIWAGKSSVEAQPALSFRVSF